MAAVASSGTALRSRALAGRVRQARTERSAGRYLPFFRGSGLGCWRAEEGAVPQDQVEKGSAIGPIVPSSRRIAVAHPDLSGNELKYVTECIETEWISSQGKFIAAFEAAFRD